MLILVVIINSKMLRSMKQEWQVEILRELIRGSIQTKSTKILDMLNLNKMNCINKTSIVKL